MDATLLREAVLENIPVIARGNRERMNQFIMDATLLREAVLENIPVIARGNSERMNESIHHGCYTAQRGSAGKYTCNSKGK